jgi:hypothetical protein
VPSIDQLIRQNINPFDPTTFKPGNFWKETQAEDQEVSSVHQGVLDSVDQTLDLVLRDRQTRTLMLLGDSGSGKSYLLGRLKRRLNDKACFAYVNPWPDSQFIWRHVLRQTVDSLLEIPEGQSDPQLIRWLKGLEILKRQGLAKRLMGERSVFVSDMRASFPSGLYRPKDFFGVLYELLNPQNKVVAYDWLRGEDLDEEDRRALRVKHCVDSEDAAQKMLGNLSKIADSTQPIVICFDNLDNIPKRADGKPDLQALFDVNSTIHNEKLKNFLILVSIITSNWRENKRAIAYPDLARVNEVLTLRAISLDQAQAIWASRLKGLHQQANPTPTLNIAPLTRDWLERQYPGGKVVPRAALMLAERMIRYFKEKGEMPVVPSEKVVPEPSGSLKSSVSSKLPVSSKPLVASNTLPPQNAIAAFELAWQKEFEETSQQVRRIAQFSSAELMRRLQETLEALSVSGIRVGVLPSPTYKSYSLEHQNSAHKVGIVWMEDASLTSFGNVMKACKKMVDAGTYAHLYLLRSAKLGTSKNKGFQLFQNMFADDKHVHLKTDLVSIQYLETYHRLVNAAAGRELVIASQTPDIPQLQALVRGSKVLAGCLLLQQLNVVKGRAPLLSPPNVGANSIGPSPAAVETAQRYILNLMATQMMMGMQAVMESTEQHVPTLSSEDLERIIQKLCDARKIEKLHPTASRENQLLYWIPN